MNSTTRDETARFSSNTGSESSNAFAPEPPLSLSVSPFKLVAGIAIAGVAFVAMAGKFADKALDVPPNGPNNTRAHFNSARNMVFGASGASRVATRQGRI